MNLKDLLKELPEARYLKVEKGKRLLIFVPEDTPLDTVDALCDCLHWMEVEGEVFFVASPASIRVLGIDHEPEGA